MFRETIARKDAMRAWLTAIIGLGCLAVTGCGGQAKHAIYALEEENRKLEDMIYQQQAELERTQQALESCRQANAGRSGAGRSPAAVASPDVRGPAVTSPPASGAPDTSRPPLTIEMPSAPTTEIPETLKNSEAPRFPGASGSGPKLEGLPAPGSAPQLEVPGPLPSEKKPPQPLRGPSQEVIPPPAPQSKRPEQGRVSGGDRQSTQVVEITLNDALTGGCHTDPQRGDQGISLLLEPRDGDGRLIAAPAAVSVVVLDPALQGEAARVARWDFSAEQLGSLYRRTSAGEGFHLEMLWPGAPPAHETLQLFVRYVTSDGRKLEVQRRIRVAVGGGGSGELTADRRGMASVGPNGERGWQQRATSAPPAEPLRLSSRLSSAASRVTASPSPSPPSVESSSPKLSRPTWSPERP